MTILATQKIRNFSTSQRLSLLALQNQPKIGVVHGWIRSQEKVLKLEHIPQCIMDICELYLEFDYHAHKLSQINLYALLWEDKQVSMRCPSMEQNKYDEQYKAIMSACVLGVVSIISKVLHIASVSSAANWEIGLLINFGSLIIIAPVYILHAVKLNGGCSLKTSQYIKAMRPNHPATTVQFCITSGERSVASQ